MKKLSWLQKCILGELYDSELEKGETINITPTELVKKNFSQDGIMPKHRVAVSNSLKRLIQRGLLQKEDHAYSLTEKGRIVAKEILFPETINKPQTVNMDETVNNKKDINLQELVDIYRRAKLALLREDKQIDPGK
jgi:hypothetical protein